MKSLKKYVATLILGFSTCQLQAQVIAPYLTKIDFNTDIDYLLNGISIFYNDEMVDNLDGVLDVTVSPLNIRNLRDAKIDGFHRDDNGRRYFSFDADTRVNGGLVLKSDIIRCENIDCSSTVLFFDANALNLKTVNINAFTLDPDNGDLIFSIASDAVITGSIFLAADLIRFDGSNFSLEYNSLSDNLSRSQNIDALTLLPNNRYLASFDKEGTAHEIFEYDRLAGIWGVAYTPLLFSNAQNNVNLNSLMAFENDVIFKNGFE
ncbi:MAG TPA: hypothetical protein ENJ41_00020 [Oceanospirillales bacterium]|nr:hypothetical protein [Oceanospirillales bacterium]